MILAGDIGGTKTNLCLVEISGNELTTIYEEQFTSSDHSDFMDIIKKFKDNSPKKNIEAICLGIAGPILEENCITTNLPWNIKSKEIKDLFKTEKVRLLNDLEATAYGMLYLKEDELVEINPKGEGSKGNIAVIAAGTGLGEAQLFFDGENYYPIGCEGGHTDFAPLNKQQDDLLKYLRVKYPEHVSYERILSGPGIYNIYEYLKESGFAQESDEMKNIDDKLDKSAEISKCALQNNDPLSIETLNLFCSIYGAEAGNLALKSMSTGGIYIGGGIAPKILPILKNGMFMENFVKKGRFKGLMESMKVKISTNQKTAILGAAYFAKDRLL